jgi:hypothetical protein
VTGGQPDAGQWRRSSSCPGGECVEVAPIAGRVAVRASGHPGNIIMFPASHWQDFVAGVKHGDFGNDRLAEQ